MKQPHKSKAFSTCTLKDLCPDDKQKVAKLVKQVVELGQENRRFKEAADKATSAVEEKLKQIQECNKQAVRENCSLKTKLGQAVTVLRMYHHKVQGLDAALRAMQNAAAAKVVAEQTVQQQQQESGDARPETQRLRSHSSSPRTCDLPLQQSTLTPDSVADMPGHLSRSSSPALSAAAAAARLQQQAQQLSEIISQQEFSSQPAPEPPTAVTPPAAAAGVAMTPASSCASTAAVPAAQVLNHYLPQSIAAGPSSVLAVSSAAEEDEKLLPITPLVLPPHCNVGAREAFRDLAQWQLQQGLVTPGQAADTTHKVLQFDPSVGSHGAFIIRDLPEITAVTAAIQPGFGMAQHPSSSGTEVAPNVQQGQQRIGFPVLGLTGSAAPSATNSSAAAGGSVSTIPGRSPSAGVAGLSDASPWDSPTNQQLLNIAAAFDNLAVLSPASAAARSHETGPAQQATPAGADMFSVEASRTLPFDTGIIPSAGSKPSAAAGASAVSVGSSISIVAGPTAEQSVEEVAVECVDAWQVPVIVQNEKSWSSMHGPASPLMMNPTKQTHQHQYGSSGVLAPQPVESGAQQQYSQQHSQQCVQHEHEMQRMHPTWQQGEHEPAVFMQQRHHQPLQQVQSTARQLQQQWPLQPQPVAAQQQQAWPQHAHSCVKQQYTVSTLQQLADLQQMQQPSVKDDSAMQWWQSIGQQSQQPWCQMQQPSSSYWSQQQQLERPHQGLQQGVVSTEHQQQQHSCQPADFAAAPQDVQSHHKDLQRGLHQPPTTTLRADHSCEAEHHPQGPLLQDSLPDSDTREMLERFDESLVDLLMEVERLEHQQQVCKRQLQQQQQQQKDSSWQPQKQQKQKQAQPHQQLQQVQPAPQQAGLSQDDYSSAQLQPHQQHGVRWDQQQQHEQRGQRRKQLQPMNAGRTAYGGWQHQDDDDDVVSDILNHLD